MSQWTHILGVVRFDSFNKNVWPEPIGKPKIIKDEYETVHQAFQHGIPFGSEGPLQVDTILTERGPTVLITGDLRDFGMGSLDTIVEWLNKCQGAIDELNLALWVRDAVVRCDVEFNEDTILIEHGEDGFMLNTLEVKEDA